MSSKDERPDTFPQRFSRILFEKHPDWEQHWVPPNLGWQSDEDIAIEIPSRFAPRCPLRVETMGNGIIISWVGWHVHCDDWCGEYTEDAFLSEALELIADLLAETRVIVTAWADGKVDSGGSSLVSELDHDLETAWSIFGRGRDIVVISWRGTYDRGSFDPAKC